MLLVVEGPGGFLYERNTGVYQGAELSRERPHPWLRVNHGNILIPPKGIAEFDKIPGKILIGSFVMTLPNDWGE